MNEAFLVPAGSRIFCLDCHCVQPLEIYRLPLIDNAVDFQCAVCGWRAVALHLPPPLVFSIPGDEEWPSAIEAYDALVQDATYRQVLGGLR